MVKQAMNDMGLESDNIEYVHDANDRRNIGETSVDSMMGDTPANYNEQNNRFGSTFGSNQNSRMQNSRIHQRTDNDTIYEGDEFIERKIKKKSTKKKKTKKSVNNKPQEYLDPSEREIDLANAYGGIAKGQPKRKNVKYTKDSTSRDNNVP